MYFRSIFYNSLFFKNMILIQFIAYFFIVIPGFTQESSEKKLEIAIDLYQNLELDKAIKMLSECIEEAKLNAEQQQLAYKYLVQACISKDLKDRAKNALKDLLDKYQSYRPDANVDKTSYINFFSEVLKEWQIEVAEKKRPWQKPDSEMQIDKPKHEIAPPPPKKKNKLKKWLLVGGGVVVAGVITVAILGCKEERGSIKISW